MKTILRVLQVEDSENDAQLILRQLEKAGYDVLADRVETAEQMQSALTRQPWDVIIADYRLPKFDAPGALTMTQQTGNDVPFIVVSGAIGEDVAVGMMKSGAHDYLLKDRLERLAPAVEREIREARIRQQHRQAEEDRSAAYTELAAINSNAPVILLVINADLRVEKVNNLAARLSGRMASELIGVDLGELFGCLSAFDDPGRCGSSLACGDCAIRNAVLDTLQNGTKHDSIEIWKSLEVDRASQAHCLLVSTAPLTLGHNRKALICAQDITPLKQAENALLASEKRYRTAFQTGLDAIAITRVRDEIYLDANQRFLDVLGYDRSELIGKSALELTIWADGGERDNMSEMLRLGSSCRDMQAKFKRKNGEIFWGIASASTLELDGELCVVSIIRDITEAKLAEDQIKSLAFFDPLTGLANRRLLMEQLRRSIALSARNHRKRGLLFVDIDRFKSVNDTLGHHIGDLLLKEVANRLAACVREVDTVSRFGGDEFAILLEDLSENASDAMAQAKTIAGKILDSVAQPHCLDGHQCMATCSVGINVFGSSNDDVNEILKQADIAMYQAKEAGRNSIHASLAQADKPSSSGRAF